ncbi:hypothetical protein V8E52_005127 [Russula decolorans]
MLFISTTNLLSVLALASTLTGLVLADGPRSQCIVKLNATDGANCTSIAQQADVNLTTIQSLNPGVNCSGPLSSNDTLCTRQYTPKCTLNETATNQTCDGLASTYNLSTTDFVNYNDNVNGTCGNLTVGQTYCVSIDGCIPGNTGGFC